MIATERLILRAWRDDDRAPFHAMCTDPRVMEFLGPPMERAETDAAIDRQNGLIASFGHGFWAVEHAGDGTFMGFCGIKPGAEGTPIHGEIEIGWRMAAPFWGQGYAREAAQASLDWGWAHLDAPGIAAITTVGNRRSRGLMERLGMVRAPEHDFEHPAVPLGSPLRPHVTYRIGRPTRR